MNDEIVVKFIYKLSTWAITKYQVYSFYLFIFYFLLIKTSFYSICLIFSSFLGIFHILFLQRTWNLK
jgi:hypothetical protein